jgi:coatomer subunit beta'
VQARPLTICEFYPTALVHSPNGRFLAVLGGSSFVVYTARQANIMAYGAAEDFAWAHPSNSNEFATLEPGGESGLGQVYVHTEFKEKRAITPIIPVDRIFGGVLLALCSSSEICFYDWESLVLVERIDVEAKKIAWNDTGTLVAVATPETLFVLRIDDAVIANKVQGVAPASKKKKGGRRAGAEGDEEPEAEDEEEDEDHGFAVVHEEVEKVKSLVWESNALVFNTADHRLCTLVGPHLTVLAHLDTPQYLLRYDRSENAVYLISKTLTLSRYPLYAAIIDLQAAIAEERDAEFLRTQVFPRLTVADLRNTAARFLDSVEQRALALEIAEDPDLRLDLAIAAKSLETALRIVEDFQRDFDTAKAAADASSASPSSSSSAAPAPSPVLALSALNVKAQAARWKKVGDFALVEGKLAIAERCFAEAKDLPSLLMLAQSSGDAGLMGMVGRAATALGEDNTAFVALFLQRKVDACVDLLLKGGRVAEASFFARSYAPWRLNDTLPLWRKALAEKSPYFAFTPAGPTDPLPPGAPLAFAHFDESVALGQWLKENEYTKSVSAHLYPTESAKIGVDLRVACLEQKTLFPEFFASLPTEKPPPPPTDP